jgi:hypothetical protein
MKQLVKSLVVLYNITDASTVVDRTEVFIPFIPCPWYRNTKTELDCRKYTNSSIHVRTINTSRRRKKSPHGPLNVKWTKKTTRTITKKSPSTEKVHPYTWKDDHWSRNCGKPFPLTKSQWLWAPGAHQWLTVYSIHPSARHGTGTGGGFWHTVCACLCTLTQVQSGFHGGCIPERSCITSKLWKWSFSNRFRMNNKEYIPERILFYVKIGDCISFCYLKVQ